MKTADEQLPEARSPRDSGRSSPRWRSGPGILLALLTLLAFGIRLARFAETPHPLGTDGYYYVVQIEHLLQQGRLHVPDGSWTLPFFGLLAWPFRDPVCGLKVGVACLAALCVPAAFFAGRNVSRSAAAGWLLAGWAAASPTLTQLAAEFPKNLGIAAPALAAIAFLAWRRSKGALALAGGLLLLAAAAHRTGAALLLCAAAGAGLGSASQRVSARRDGLPTGWVVLGLGVLFAGLAALLPNLLHPADLERLTGQFRLRLSWPPPAAFFPLHRPSLPQAIELLSAWPLLILGLRAWFRKPELRPALGALMAPILVAVFPFWKPDLQGVGYRLGLLLPLLCAPLAALLLLDRLPGSARGALAAAWLAAVPFLSRAGADPRALPPYDRFRSVIDAIPRPLPSLLVAHQGMNFYYDHLTGQEAMAWAPEPELDRTHIGRVAWGIRKGEWREWAEAPGLPPPVPLVHGYAYVREDVWERLVESARRSDDDEALERIQDWRNPARIRPRYLLRNHR